jgi:hypothetical protein
VLNLQRALRLLALVEPGFLAADDRHGKRGGHERAQRSAGGEEAALHGVYY